MKQRNKANNTYETCSLPRATYSKKHTWHNRVAPMFDIYKQLAHEISVEIDKEILAKIDNKTLEKIDAMCVKDGNE